MTKEFMKYKTFSLMFLFIFILIFSLSLSSASGVTVTSVSTSSVITKDTEPSSVEWIINTNLDGGGQSLTGTVTSEAMKSFLGENNPHPDKTLSISVSAVDEEAIYSVDNEKNIGVYYYDTSEWYECPNKFLGLCTDDPTPCSKSADFEIRDTADYNPAADYEYRYCVYKERIGTKGVFNEPTVKFEADISLSAGGKTVNKKISSDQSSVSLDGVATATWTGTLVTGEGLPKNINNYVAIKETDSNKWKIIRESTYDNFDDAESIADNNLNNLQDTGGSDDIELYEVENAVSSANSASNIVMSSDESYSESYFSEFNEDTGNFIVTLDRSLGNPNVVFRVKASWIGLVIPSGEPSILSLDSNSFGSGETGSINVKIKNVGDVEGTFSAKLVDCAPFNILSTSSSTRITLSSGEEGEMLITLDAGSTSDDISKSCKVEVYDVNNPSVVASQFVNLAMTSAKVCTPEKTSAEGNLIKKCNNEGTKLEVIEECEEGVEYDKKLGYFCSLTPEEKEKYECVVDNDCGDFAYCNSEIRACVQKSGCFNVIDNGNSDKKMDVVFVGDGYFNNDELEEDVLKIVDYQGDNGMNGLMSVEPFKSNKEKFNIWMIKAEDKITSNQYGDLDRGTSLEIAAQCTSADYQIIMSKKTFRSYAYFSGDAYLSLGSRSESNWGRLLLHEFGHSFGKLADEYVEPSKGNRAKFPNCAPDTSTAQEWWSGISNIGFYEGCSYIDGNVRSTLNSIMRAHWILKDDYGEVNEKALLERLSKYE